MGCQASRTGDVLGRALTVVSLSLLLGASSCRETSSPSDYLGPHVAWQVPINFGNAEFEWGGVPVVADGRFFFAEGPDVTALDRTTGTRLWSTRVRANLAAVTSKFLWHGSKIFFPDAPDVFCLDAATGQILWRYAPDSQAVVAESAIDDHAMYIGTRDHKVLALDINDGHPIWTVDVGPGWTELGLVQGISLASDTVYVGVTHWIAHNGYLQSAVIVALDRDTGKELWRYQGTGDQNGIVATPVVAGNNLIVDDVKEKIVIELKAVEGLGEKEPRQLQNYLRVLAIPRGFLINFPQPTKGKAAKDDIEFEEIPIEGRSESTPS